MITKENVHVRREFNYHRIGSEHQHGRFEHQYGRRDVIWKRSILDPGDGNLKTSIFLSTAIVQMPGSLPKKSGWQGAKKHFHW